jgi:DNA-binding transcriptional LysR family regulator
MSQHKANLDAWHVLRTVIDAGGFAQAAEQLQRSQSAVSYSVARLQEQLGLELLSIEGRRAVLTPQGSLLLAQSRQLLDRYDAMMSVASELRSGHQPGLQLWIDSYCTTGFLLPVLGEFQTRFPDTVVSISQGLAGQSKSDLSSSPHLAVTTQAVWDTPRISLGEISYVAVTHCNHPLQGHDRQLTPSDLAGYRKVSLATGDDPGKPHWLVTDIYQALGAVLSGQAYGWLPEKIIKDELVKGSLLPLSLEEGSRYRVPVFLQYNDRPLGNNGKVLGELITQYFSRTAA